MSIDIGITGIVRGDRQVCASECRPPLGVASPTIGVATGELCLGMNGEAVHAEAEFVTPGANRVNASG